MSPQKVHTVLLLEDDPREAILVQRDLQLATSAKFEFDHVLYFRDALARLAEQPYDAMISDLGLPDISGIETVRQIRKLAPDLPLIVLTGCENDQTAIESLREGAQDFLVKSELSLDGKSKLERSLRYAMNRQAIHSENCRLLAL
ncbi:MAG: response regulator, partial [Planctomycetota bacterium]|nr:response regulator [Planctomycetota bacterium]